MELQEHEYLDKIISSIALILNEDLTIRHINRAGLKRLPHVNEQSKNQVYAQLNPSTKQLAFDRADNIQNEHWEKFFNAIPMPVFIKDRQHRWIFFNDALCSLQNKTRIELQDKNDYDFFPKMQADLFWKEEETIFHTGKGTFAEEPSLRNGAESYVLIKKNIIKTNDGREYLIGCCIDITKRKQAELALIESERRFRSLIRHSPDIITIIGKDHLIRYFTPSFYRLFDFTENEMIGSSVLEILHEDDVQTYLATIAALEGSKLDGVKAEIRLKKKNGKYITLESFFKDLSFDPAIDGIVINCSDITTLQNQRTEIERMNKILEVDNAKLSSQLRNEINARINSAPLSFDDFKRRYPDDLSCLKQLSELKWSRQYSCKKCKGKRFGNGKLAYARRCSKCGYEETVTTNTVFHRIKFPILQAFYLFFLLRSNPKLSAKDLANFTSVKENTCWLFKRKLNNILNAKHSEQQSWETQIMTSAL